MLLLAALPPPSRRPIAKAQVLAERRFADRAALFDLGLALVRIEERVQFLFEQTRVVAGLDREDAFDHDLAQQQQLTVALLDLGAERQPQQVGERDAEERRDERLRGRDADRAGDVAAARCRRDP